MAEAIELAFAILGAFNDAVQCFEYVQVARNFDQDFQTATLKLDISRLRLSRWGQSVGMDRVEKNMHLLPTVAGSLEDHQKAKELLDQIVELFDDAERKSAKMKPPAREATAYDIGCDLEEAAASLHKKLEILSLRRFKPATMLKRVKWALYKEKHLNRLIQDATELVNGLIELFPAARPEKSLLYEEDGAQLASDQNVSLITPLILDQDPELNTSIQSQNFHISFEGSQDHGLQQGYFSGQQTNNFACVV